MHRSKTTSKKEKKQFQKETISVASWNIQNFSPSTSSQKASVVSGYIGSLFAQGTAMVFLQEIQDKNGKNVFDEDILKTSRYVPFVSKKVGYASHKERYAILVHPKFLLEAKSAPIPFYIQNKAFK